MTDAPDRTHWQAVDDYLHGVLAPPDPALEEALASSHAAALPTIAVSPNLGRLLTMLAEIQGARRILEVGTLGGYSTICLGRALPPNGCLVSLELEPRHAAVARENVDRAGLGERVEIRVGAALEALADLASEDGGPFDLVFIDADKEGYPDYLEAALRLARPGTLIVADNVVRHGRVIDADSTDASVRGVRSYLERCGAHPRLSTVAVPIAGAKGYDGIAISRVVA